jgi:hypothetical protein
MLLIAPHPTNDKYAHSVALSRKTEHDYLFTPIKFHEGQLLDSEHLNYLTVRRYYDHHLPGMKLTVLKLMERHGADGVHIDLGSELGSLYAAYFALCARDGGVETSGVAVTVHRADDIGGSSMWLNSHPLLRRYLALQVFNRADMLCVTSKETALALLEAFPKINRDLVGAPLVSEESTPAIHALPSE